MTKQIFQDLPNTTTPITAANLNKLNNVSIGTSTPTLNEELWVKSSNKENILTSSIMSKNTTTYAGLTLTKISDTKWKLNGTNTESTDWNFNFTISNGNLGKKCIVYLKTAITNIKFQIDSIYNYNQKALIENTIPAFGIRVLGGATYNNAEIEVVIEEYSLSETYTNINGTYKKYTDTVSVGIDSNNAGLWVQHSKNLLDLNSFTNFTAGGATFTCNNGIITVSGTPTATSWSTVLSFQLDAGTYTFSGVDSLNDGGLKLVCAVGDNQYTIDSGTKTKTFTVSSLTGCQLVIWVQNTSSFPTGAVVLNPMIEYGSTKTDFEPYVNEIIKVNNHGVYQPITYKNVYSYNEVVIGEWFGRVLYRKIIDLGSTLTFSSTNWVTSGFVSGEIGQIVNCVGYQPNGIMPRMMAVMMQGSLQLMNPYAFDTQLRYIILEYIKTTNTGISTLSD